MAKNARSLRKKTKDQSKILAFLVEGYLREHGATTVGAVFVGQFAVDTCAGVLHVHADHEGENMLSVYSRFDNIPKALERGLDVNRYSGKWNHHFTCDEPSAERAFAQWKSDMDDLFVERKPAKIVHLDEMDAWPPPHEALPDVRRTALSLEEIEARGIDTSDLAIAQLLKEVRPLRMRDELTLKLYLCVQRLQEELDARPEQTKE